MSHAYKLCPSCQTPQPTAGDLVRCWLQDDPSIRTTLSRDAIATVAGCTPARVSQVAKALGLTHKPHVRNVGEA